MDLPRGRQSALPDHALSRGSVSNGNRGNGGDRGRGRAAASAEAKLEPAARWLARLGCFAVGTVYVLIGVWAMLALLRLADPAADEQRILQRILELPFGSVIIGAIALGTIGYVLWLLFEAVFDPYRFGARLKGVVERIGTALSAFGYGLIAWSALKVLLGKGRDGEDQQRLLVGAVLDWPAGRWLIGAVGLVVALAGLCQIKYVYDGEHRRRIRMDGDRPLTRLVLNAMGWLGYGARAAILLVIAGFLLRAAWSVDPAAVGDTDSAFDFLGLGGGRLGDALFSTVALGTIDYGLFLYITGARFDFGDDNATTD